MTYPVPEVWIVSGMLNQNGVPFYAGKVYAYNLKNGVPRQIAETGIASNGFFTLTYSRWDFQQGNQSIEYPTLH